MDNSFYDQAMLEALTDLDEISAPSVMVFILIAAKYGVDTDGLFEEWCEC